MPDFDPHDPIVILTGAGISKESGLDTFRDADGIWSRVRIEDGWLTLRILPQLHVFLWGNKRV